MNRAMNKEVEIRIDPTIEATPEMTAVPTIHARVPRIIATSWLLAAASLLLSCASQTEKQQVASCCSEQAASPERAGSAETASCCSAKTDGAADVAGSPSGSEAAKADPVDEAGPAASGTAPEPVGMRIPDVALLDQHGNPVRFYSDLVKGKVVAMSFFFTTCTTICPPLTMNMAKLQSLLGDRMGREVHLISITVDPVVDTPERLQAWAEKFGAGPGWTFLTGKKKDVDDLLKALSAFTSAKEDHTPFVLIGNEVAGRWTRANGLGAPARLLEAIDGVIDPTKREVAAVAADGKGTQSATPFPAAATSSSGSVSPTTVTSATPPTFEALRAPGTASTAVNAKALEYFTDVELLDQDGEVRRFYSDLLRDKVVVIDCFFSQCTSVCPMLNARFQKIQEKYADRMGKDLHLISLSVDSGNDTPERLHEYAERLGARKGWYFLTGKKENIDLALRKVGLYVESRDSHSTVLLIGNDRTGLWKKAVGLAKEEDVLRVVDSVLKDSID